MLSRFMSSGDTSSPLMGDDLYFGKMIAACGQTRAHAGQLVLQAAGLATLTRLSLSRPYTPNKQKLRHWWQLLHLL
ncbi:MAG: hypothetical protein ACP5MD_17280 [Verrucomicrobiia bacterium]